MTDFMNQLQSSATKAAPMSLSDMTKPEAGGGGKTPVYHVNPYALAVEPGFNPREFASEERAAYIDQLALSIKEEGVHTPLVVRPAEKDGGSPIVVNGECRLRATKRAIEHYGAEIKTIPVMVEPKGTDPAKRLLRVVGVYNRSNPLTPLEQATAVAKAIGMGWTHENVALELGVSRERVYQLLDIEGLAPELKAHVKAGVISPTLAVEAQKEHGSAAADVVGIAVEANKGKTTRTAKGGKKQARVKPKQVLSKEPKGGKVTPKVATKGEIAETAQVLCSLLNKAKVTVGDKEAVIKMDKAAWAKAQKAMSKLMTA